MYRLASSGEIGEPCGMPHRLSLASVVRLFLPRSSVSSTGQTSHILIRCSTRRSTIRRATELSSSAWGCSRSSPQGRRQRLPGGLETAALAPPPPPVARCAQDGKHTVLVEGRLRRSALAPASLLSCRPDHARSRCPVAGVCHWLSLCTLF